ncbi:C25 family cysteine peptidase [Candidatus Eisenbacteria bacterium]|uniref:C25 family cysteine peptidase n=1 Tax=Eiseniibacteriota bacterium TaxID=2212470 RepID=A0ABV6YIB2_UNCEI
MRVSLTCCFVVLCIFSAAAVLTSPATAWMVREADGGGMEFVGQVHIQEGELSFRELHGFDVVDIEGGRYLETLGSPMLPVKQIRVAIPQGWTATGVRATTVDSEELKGVYNILPAQPPLTTNMNSWEEVWVVPNHEVYASPEAYPTQSVRFLGQCDLAGQAMAVIDLYPLAYIPLDGILSLHTSLSLAIECSNDGARGDFLPLGTSAQRAEAYEQKVAGMVINPEQVQVLTPGPMASRTSRLDPGTFDYVVIAQPDYVDAFDPLIEWKMRKGSPATFVSIDFIDSEYTAPEDEERIREFIIDANATWGTTYFLLGGDTNRVPFRWTETPIDPGIIPNDTYYADFDDDWVVEVNVGRIPARYPSEAIAYVDKILTYEKTPPLIEYGHKALMLGFDLDAESPGEATKEFIVAQSFPPGWNVSSVYDSHTGDHKVAAIAEMDAGHNLINHIDHCNTDEMGLGSTNHDAHMGHYVVNHLVNGDRKSIVYTTGCWPNAYDDLTCIGEAWVKASGGGAIAFVGNSRFGWYQPGNIHALSNYYDEQFFEQLLTEDKYHLGECFTGHKNTFVPGGDTGQYIFTELTLLGDPEMPVWTNDPQELVVTCPTVIPLGFDDFTVRVETGARASVSDATVCLWKEDEGIYLTGTTDYTGEVTFAPAPATEGVMMVTVTKRDCLPSLCDVVVDTDAASVEGEVVGAAVSTHLYASNGNPFRGSMHIRYDLARPGRVELGVFDLSGRQVRSLVNGDVAAGQQSISWNGKDDRGRELPAGVYMYVLNAADHRAARRMVKLD